MSDQPTDKAADTAMKVAKAMMESLRPIFSPKPDVKLHASLSVPITLTVDEAMFASIIRRMVNTPPLPLKSIPRKHKRKSDNSERLVQRVKP
jgi:hypothetical protein